MKEDMQAKTKMAGGLHGKEEEGASYTKAEQSRDGFSPMSVSFESTAWFRSPDLGDPSPAS